MPRVRSFLVLRSWSGSQSTGLEFKAVSGSDGAFVIPSLPIGLYTVVVTARGFKQAFVEDGSDQVIWFTRGAGGRLTLRVGASRMRDMPFERVGSK